MELTQQLERAGLTKNSAKVYLALLQHGTTSAAGLAKHTELDRAVAYQVLSSLTNKGLVNHIVKENKKYFSAADPKNLLQAIAEQELFVHAVIKNLSNVHPTQKSESTVEVYEGKAGLKTLLTELLKAKEICFFGATGGSYDVLRFEMPHITKQVEKKGLRGRGVADETVRKEPFTKIKNISMRYLTKVPSRAATTIIDGHTVAIHSTENKPFIIIIKNESIAETYRNYFEALWKTARP